MRRSSIVYVLLALIVCAIVAGISYEQVGRRQDVKRYPQVGRSVDVGGRSLNILCSGQGRPTVVFETFSHQAGYSWSAVQPLVAKFTRACWYDRANYGWSDPGPIPTTLQANAQDLHALLHAAGEEGPFIFVGAGDGAMELRIYHRLYSKEVAGILMVNPNDVDDSKHGEPEFAKGAWAKHFGSLAPRVRGIACVAMPAMSAAGIVRLVDHFQNLRPTMSYGLTPEEQQELDFLSDNPTAARGGGVCGREESMNQVRQAGDLGDLPLVVLSSRNEMRAPRSSNDGMLKEAESYNYDRAVRVLPGLARLSTRGRLVFLEDGQEVGLAIVDAVRDLAANVAGGNLRGH